MIFRCNFCNIACCACYLNRQSSTVDGPISKYKHVIIASIGVKTYKKMKMGFLWFEVRGSEEFRELVARNDRLRRIGCRKRNVHCTTNITLPIPHQHTTTTQYDRVEQHCERVKQRSDETRSFHQGSAGASYQTIEAHCTTSGSLVYNTAK